MTSSFKIYFSGPEQRTPSDEGDWKIFINEKLIKSQFWPQDASSSWDNETMAFTIRSKNFDYMTGSAIESISDLLLANGFQRYGYWFEPTFCPRTNSIPPYVKDPKESPPVYIHYKGGHQ